MNHTENTQDDVSSFTVPVTDEMRERVYEKHLDEYEQGDPMPDGGVLAIEYGDNPDKADDERNDEYALGGYLAEEAVAEFLKAKGIEYEHQGEEGTVDFLIHGCKKVEVKSRQSKTEFRNGIVNEYKQSDIDYSDIDQYFFTCVHFSAIDGSIVAVELLGVANRSDVVDDADNIELHGGRDQHVKFEYPTSDMIGVQDWASIASI